MQLKQVSSTSSSTSGFHVVKEFLHHAFTIMKGKKEKEEHLYNNYLSIYSKDEEREIHNDKKIPTWILRNFTVPQMEQIKIMWREEKIDNLFSNYMN